MAKREKKIAFVEHPITSDEKWAIIEQGYQIVDLRFAPDELPKGAKVIKKSDAKAKK